MRKSVCGYREQVVPTAKTFVGANFVDGVATIHERFSKGDGAYSILTESFLVKRYIFTNSRKVSISGYTVCILLTLKCTGSIVVGVA